MEQVQITIHRIPVNKLSPEALQESSMNSFREMVRIMVTWRFPRKRNSGE